MFIHSLTAAQGLKPAAVPLFCTAPRSSAVLLWSMTAGFPLLKDKRATSLLSTLHTRPLDRVRRIESLLLIWPSDDPGWPVRPSAGLSPGHEWFRVPMIQTHFLPGQGRPTHPAPEPLQAGQHHPGRGQRSRSPRVTTLARFRHHAVR